MYFIQMSQGERLIRARVHAGYEKAVDAIERFEWSKPSYYAHEGDRTTFSFGTAKKYARAFGVRAFG